MVGIIKAVLLTFFMFIHFIALSQNSYNLPPSKFYPQATLGFKNFEKKKVRNLMILEDSLKYSFSGVEYTDSFEEINYIRIRKGTKTGGGALLGGATMLIISLLAILDVQADPNYELKDNTGQRVAMFTLGGAAVGGIIGSFITKEASYYLHVNKVN